MCGGAGESARRGERRYRCETDDVSSGAQYKLYMKDVTPNSKQPWTDQSRKDMKNKAAR
eukprot:SAG31_NODE_38005_length_299_cov_2.865000_2_plen_58_part_01